MNKSVLLLAAALLVVGAGGMVGAGTQAVFTDTAASSGNTFVAGTLDMVLSDVNETDQQNVTASITGATMKPNDYKTGTITVKNSGSLAGTYTMATSTTETDTNSDATPDLGGKLKLRISVQGSGACDNPGSADNESLTALTNDTGLYGTAGGAAMDVGAIASRALAAGASEVLCFEVLFPNSSDNTYQGDSTDATFSFTLTQS